MIEKLMKADFLQRIIQDGMGIEVSNWRLARAQTPDPLAVLQV